METEVETERKGAGVRGAGVAQCAYELCVSVITAPFEAKWLITSLYSLDSSLLDSLHAAERHAALCV